MDSNVISATVGALAGGTISALTYYFRGRKERGELINVALFHLLDVWRLLSMMCFFQSDTFSKTLTRRFKEEFPAEKITDKDEATFATWGRQAMPLLMGASIDSQKSISHIYEEAIHRLAPIYPVPAFELKANVFLINYMHLMEKLFSEDPSANEMQVLLAGFKSTMYEESLLQLEDDIKALALRSGPFSWFLARRYTARIKERLAGPPDEAVDLVIEKIIAPLIEKHYLDLGVPDPNKKVM